MYLDGATDVGRRQVGHACRLDVRTALQKRVVHGATTGSMSETAVFQLLWIRPESGE